MYYDEIIVDKRLQAETSCRADHLWTAPRSMATKLLAAGGWHPAGARDLGFAQALAAGLLRSHHTMYYDERIVDERSRAESSRRANVLR